MKELRNSMDSEIRFEDLAEAKKYYFPSEEVDVNVKNPDDYIGSIEFSDYLEEWEEYKAGITEAESLEELANVLNEYMDIFYNGSEYKVVEI